MRLETKIFLLHFPNWKSSWFQYQIQN